MASTRIRETDTRRMESVRLELEQFLNFIHPHSIADRLDFVLPYATDPSPEVRRIMLEFLAEHVDREHALIPTGVDVLESLLDLDLDPEVMEVGRRVIAPVPKWLGSVQEHTTEMMQVKAKCERMFLRTTRAKSDIFGMLQLPARKLETKLEKKPGKRLRLIKELKSMAAGESLRKRAIFMTFLKKHRGTLDIEIVGS